MSFQPSETCPRHSACHFFQYSPIVRFRISEPIAPFFPFNPLAPAPSHVVFRTIRHFIRLLSIRQINLSSREHIGEAAEYAIRHQAKVINLSFGSRGEAAWRTIRRVMETHPGVLFVAAAGNNGNNLDEHPVFPAAWDLPNLITVASVDESGNLDPSSNFSKNKVHVAAKGMKVLGIFPEGRVSEVSGTSFAAPVITNLIARIYVTNPNLTATEVVAILQQSVTPIPELKEKTRWGGVVDSRQALLKAAEVHDGTASERAAASFSVPAPHRIH